MAVIDAALSAPPGAPAQRGGVLLRVGAAMGFVPAEVARRLTALTALTPVPGTRSPVAGIALADGAVVTVLRLGAGETRRSLYEPETDWPVPGADRAVLCQVGGFDVALIGGVVLTTGVFDVAPGGEGVLWRGEDVPVLDVRALYAQAEAATWAERAVTSGPPGAPSHAPPIEIRSAADRTALLPEPPDDGRGSRA